ncbi:MAG: DEAD/DEAH box helicase [Candidatus Eremiobacterota bacterium]
MHIDLIESLKTGFIDQSILSRKEYLPQLLVNNKNNGKKVLRTIDRCLRICDEFWFSVAFVTKSGVVTLINVLKELEYNGIQGKLLVSQYQNFTQPEALRSLLQFNNIDLRIAVNGDFHAKGYLFKKGNIYDLVIGSSNLTANALCSNKEWNLKISTTEKGQLIKDAINEFKSEFDNAVEVNYDFIDSYETIYKSKQNFFIENKNNLEVFNKRPLKPNTMQVEALTNLKYLRANNKNKALLISATGTGKTYLSVFDVKEFNPKRFLFVVHRANIAEAAMKSFKKVFGNSRTMGMYSGEKKESDSDFIFSTIQTISKNNHLTQFNKDHFDYIVIDETHRAGAETYKKILDYFKPTFILGMTATPERTDGFDIFKQFDYNIAYEIRLHRALEEQMLCPFHYFGVTDITVNGQVLEENSAFSLLTANERVERIIEKAEFYGCDNGCIRGLIFCSSIEESNELSKAFNLRGYKSVSLCGVNSEKERTDAISRLESDNKDDKLDYIFTVDIFNEGIDIPRVNQIIMLRPTQSAIIFVQQLGRGLRKADNKEYLTVIDFIGNYNNNYLVPIALYGDTTYNKDTLRKLMSSGSNLIPGASTINFDKISRDRIFEAIDNARLNLKKDLLQDYELLKFKIGKIPMMMDFIEHGSRDPQLYVEYSKSYFNFVNSQEKSLQNNRLPQIAIKLLELFSNEIANTKRIEEVIIIKELLKFNSIQKDKIKRIVLNKYGVISTNDTLDSCVKNINFEFVTDIANKKLISVREKYNLNIISDINGEFKVEGAFKALLNNEFFVYFLVDMLTYSESIYDKYFDKNKYFGGFILYRKYSRKDVFRILNWDKNPIAQNVGGYIINSNKTNCPIFVNYYKEECISKTTKYEDGFINNYEFEWMSKSKRTLKSPDVLAIKNYKNGLRLPLFIKKSNGEGSDFYYMGDVTPIDESFKQTTMPDDNGKNVSVVKVRFRMNQPVEDSIYEYITKSNNN